MRKEEETFGNDYDYTPVAPIPRPKLDEPEVSGPIEMEEQRVVCVADGKQFAPKLMFYGCGGFGVNQIRDLPSKLGYPNAEYRIIDTSMANTHRQEIDPCIEIKYVGESGHGKVRNTNLEVMQQAMDQLIYMDDDDYDIAVVIFSLSGGSGSVAGPLIVKALTRKDKPVLVVTVADGRSTVDCENSIKTIRSLENIAKNSYVNMLLFDNSVAGWEEVDKSILVKLHQFTSAINLNNINFLDKSDIVTAMRPFHHTILSNVRGLFSMKINTGHSVCYDSDEFNTCHSSIVVEHSSIPDVTNKYHTSIHYDGKFINPSAPVHLVFGLPVSQTFMKKYEMILKHAQAASGAHNIKATIAVEGAVQHSSGLEV